MKTFFTILSVVASSNALIARQSTCCFGISASGAVSGTVGQLSDGQNRQGGGLSPAEYCITNSEITDSNGRGCILTPPTTQFQCDTGATPSSGFSIKCNGVIAYNGNTTFYECQTGDNGEANIYTEPDGTNCGAITLTASSCFSACPTSGCPKDLTGNYEFPHLIIPIDSSQPTSAPGTSFFGKITSTVSSIFNFDIPASDAGQTCELVFLFPQQSQLTTSSFTFSGTGGVDFALLNGVATSATSFSNAPSVKIDYGTTVVAPGNAYTIASFPCPAGTAISFEMMAVGNTALNYFQDYNPCPIGLYITVS